MGLSATGIVQQSQLSTAEKNWTQTVNKANEYGATTSVKNIFSKTDLKQSAIDNFSNYVSALKEDFPTRGLSLSERTEFNAQLTERLDNLVTTFNEKLGETPSSAECKAAIKTANHDVRLLVSALQGEFAQSVIVEKQGNTQAANFSDRPQVIVNRDALGNVTYASITKAPSIKEINFSGGGAKGAVYPNVMAILERFGQMQDVVRLSGTSAGGITATLLATGIDAEGYQAFADAVPMDTLKANITGFADRYTGITIPDHGRTGTENSGQQAVNLIDEKLSTMVKVALQDVVLDLDTLNTGREADLFTPEEVNRLEQLQQVDVATHPRDATMLTFKDLKLLRKLDPTIYKELQLTGYNTKTNEGLLFNADTTPNLPIAYAVRVTMALPGLFKAVKFPADGAAAQAMRVDMDPAIVAMMAQGSFVDGGFNTNVPYIESENVSQEHTRTLAFQVGGYATAALHGPTSTPGEAGPAGLGMTDKATAVLAGRYGGHNNLTDVYRRDMETLYNLGHGVIVIAHGDMGTTDLAPSAETLAFAKQDAETGVLAYLAMTANEAVYTHHESLEVAIDVTFSELNAIELELAIKETFETLNDEDKNQILTQDRNNLSPANQALFDLVQQKSNE